MEFAHYLRLILRHWPSFLFGVIVTTGVSALLVVPKPDVYEATATYVIRPTAADTSDSVRAFDTLIRGVEIPATYAEIARSDIVRDRARARVAAETEFETAGLVVLSEVTTGTNIMAISVQGEDRQAAAVFAQYIGEETEQYIVALSDGFRIDLLDPPTVPRSPVGPNRELDLALAVILGLIVGTFLALGVEAWKRQKAPYPELNVIDTETGLYNADFFRLRVDQELDRASRSDRPLSFGMIRIARGDPWASGKALSDPEELRFYSSVPPGDAGAVDVVYNLGDGTLAFLMPDADLPQARKLASEWAAWIKPFLLRDSSQPYDVGSGACECVDTWFICDDQVRKLVDRVMGKDRSERPEITTDTMK